MATYLQGVTDYIPEFQPFQPDLNFYSNVLQTKQSQYDSNWKALNKMYGQYFYADLTRDGNIKKKDELLKNMEFNLKRVSQLDLSLEQNVNQATQVFKPFYEDKNLMKDMAWTKTYNSQVGRAQSLQGSADIERRKQFWDTGLKELQYKREEFKNADDATAMSFGNVAYTPYVNSVELAQKIAKDAGLSIETVDFSPDGKWIITQKNGEKLREPLSKLFEARLGSDPSVQAVYKTQAYVNRKDYAASNAAQFNGDQNAAEMKYLEDSFNILKEQNAQRYRSIQDRSKSYDDKIKEIEKSIANKTAAPSAEKLLNEYKQAKEINDKILERVEKQNSEFNQTSSSTPSTSTGFINPYGDVNSLRWKVDAGMASMLMSKDLNEAAEIFAYKDAKTSIKENPYKVLEVKHAQSMQQIHARGSYSVRAAGIRAQGARDAARIRNAGELETLKTSEGLKKGYLKSQPRIDPRTGKMATDQYGNPIVDIVPNENEAFEYKSITSSTDQLNPADLLNNAQQRKTQQFQGFNSQLALWLKNAKDSKALSDEEIDEILNPGDFGKINPETGQPTRKGSSRFAGVTEGGTSDYRVDDYVDFDDEKRVTRAPRVTLDNMDKLTAQDIYNLEKTFIPVKSKYSADPKAEKYIDTRNYYDAVITKLESTIQDNYDIPYIAQTMPTLRQTIQPVKFAAYVNHDIEDFKYQTRLAMESDPEIGPIAKMMFDKDNNLLSKEELRQIASKSIYGEKLQPESSKNFFEAIGDSFMFLASSGRNSMDAETLKYWNGFFRNEAPTTWLGEKLATAPYGPAGAIEKLIMGDKYIDPNPDNRDALYVKLKNKLEDTYDKVFKNATSSEWYKNNNLANMPTFSVLNEGGTGFAATGTGIQVLPQAPGTKGFNSWHGFASDFRNMPSFDGKENAILFGNTEGITGTEKTAMDDIDTAITQTRKGQAILQALISQSSLPDNDLKPFTIAALPMAGGDYNKAAMVIIPDAEWLKQFKATDKDNTNNLLTNDEYNAIIQNGLSVISSSDAFANPLMGSAYKTPLENIVDYRGSYEEVVPGGGKFRIDKGTKGTSNYITSLIPETYDPITKETYEDITYDSFSPKDRQLELYLNNGIDYLNANREDNIRAYNGYYDGN
jgi:hypothetical protein